MTELRLNIAQLVELLTEIANNERNTALALNCRGRRELAHKHLARADAFDEAARICQTSVTVTEPGDG